MIDDDVVTCRVDHLIVIEEKNVVRHVALKSGDELGLQSDLRIIRHYSCTGSR